MYNNKVAGYGSGIYVAAGAITITSSKVTVYHVGLYISASCIGCWTEGAIVLFEL